MRILLVEPNYRRGTNAAINKAALETTKIKDDESLWYPPLGLMKLSTFHKSRGDSVHFRIGKDKSLLNNYPDFFEDTNCWDRVYITTLFTYDWKTVIDTIEFYKKVVAGSAHKVFVGGIMASILPDKIFQETGIQPIIGLIDSPRKISLDGSTNIDLLPPDYSLLNNKLYAINSTYYAYTTRGCISKCQWCAVPEIEPTYHNYIDIKPSIRFLRSTYGDKPRLKLMDNNILASPNLELIVNDLLELGYGRGQYTETNPKRLRVIDFNQGVDANHINESTMSLISKLRVRPMRIAFDRLAYKNKYISAIKTARSFGFKEFSNYMLYNERDTPRDLYERLMINISINHEWSTGRQKDSTSIYSYPMRFAPIKDIYGAESYKNRDYIRDRDQYITNDGKDLNWCKRFTRNVEIIKGASNGAIPPRPDYALRALGATYDEYISNLYMPEELLRYRNKYEKKVYSNEPERAPGTGDIEAFRTFITDLLKKANEETRFFHNAIAPCTKESIRSAIESCNNEEVIRWLEWYLK